MVYIERLDKLLCLFYKHQGIIGQDGIIRRYNAINKNTTWHDVIPLIDKLVKDGYLLKAEGYNKYQISVEGSMFCESGGYSKQRVRLNVNQKFKKTTNVSNLVTPILTLLVALATLVRTFAGCDKQVIEVIHTDKPTQTQSIIKNKPELSAKDSLTKSPKVAKDSFRSSRY